MGDWATQVIERLGLAESSGEFAAALAVCRQCVWFVPAGLTCTGCANCGGDSVRLRWAQQKSCPREKW